MVSSRGIKNLGGAPSTPESVREVKRKQIYQRILIAYDSAESLRRAVKANKKVSDSDGFDLSEVVQYPQSHNGYIY